MRLLRTSAPLLAIFIIAAAMASVLLYSSQNADSAAPLVVFSGEEPISLQAATTGIRWAGYSPSTYNGLLGGTGFKGANQVCQTNYPGSHWANASEIMALGTRYPWTQTAWLADFYYDQAKDCGHFTSNSGSWGADVVDTKTIYGEGGTNSGWACSNSLYIPCVYRP